MRTALLLTAAFILGVAAGFLLSHLARPGVDPRRKEGFAGFPAGEARPAPAVARLDADRPAVPGEPAGASDEVAAVVPSSPGDSGPGVIAGIVRAEEGQPVAGVRIHAFRNHAGARAPRDGEIREIRTDEAGEFRFGGFALASHSIEAFLEGYEIHPDPNMNVNSRDLWPDAFISFIARPVVPLPVEVLLPDGSSPEAAVIECVRRSSIAGNRYRRAWSRGDPVLRLPPSLYELTAHHGRDKGLRSEPVEVDLRAGETPSPVTLRLEARPGVRGRVIFPEGEEVDSVRVHALRWNAPDPPGFRDFLGGGTSAGARGSDGYHFVIEDLPPGRYLLGTGRPAEEIEVIEEVEIKDRAAVRDLVLPPLDPAAYAVLWVLDPDGEPTTDVRLHAGCSSGSGSSNTTVYPIRRPDRSLWVIHHRQGICGREGEEVVHNITVESNRYGTRRVEYRLPLGEELVVQFSEPATLEIMVAGYAGSGHEGWVHLGLRRKDQKGGVGISGGDIDLRGRARFQRIEPGEYELDLNVKTRVGTGFSSSMGLASHPITVLAGRNEATIPLPPLHDLIVQTGGESVRLDLRRLAGEDGGAPGFQINGLPAGPGGLASFERIPAGRYQLTSRGGPSGEMLVDVPAPSFILFSPRPFDAMRVQVTDPAGYLARAGFRSGDLIVGIDGTAFENETQMEALMDGARIKEQVVLAILRAGGRIEVPFDPGMRRKYLELGGSLVRSSR